MTPDKKIDRSRWTPAEAAAYEEALAAVQEEEARAEAMEAAEQARLASPAYQTQLLRERAEELRVARAEAERKAEAERVLIMAQREHGADKVAVLTTLRGPIAIRCPSASEMDANALRLSSLPISDHEKVWRDFTASCVVYPPERESFLRIMAEFGGTWSLLSAMRDELSSAARAETAKKG